MRTVDQRRVKPGTRRQSIATGEIWRVERLGDPLDTRPRVKIVLERDPANKVTVDVDYWLDDTKWQKPPRRPPAKEPDPEPTAETAETADVGSSAEPEPPPKQEHEPIPGKRLPRGPCPVCGADVALRKGGLVRQHHATRNRPDIPDYNNDQGWCIGSGREVTG